MLLGSMLRLIQNSGVFLFSFWHFHLDFCHGKFLEFFLQFLIGFPGGNFQLNCLFFGDFAVRTGEGKISDPSDPSDRKTYKAGLTAIIVLPYGLCPKVF